MCLRCRARRILRRKFSPLSRKLDNVRRDVRLILNDNERHTCVEYQVWITIAICSQSSRFLNVAFVKSENSFL